MARTILSIVASISLLVAAFAVASPARAGTEHCGGGQSAPAGAINVDGSGSGSVVVDGTTVHYVVDGRTVSFYADPEHGTALDVSFCVKASSEAFDELSGSDYTTPEHRVSYFVVYGVSGGEITNDTAALNIHKEDTEGAMLPGAVFEIVNEQTSEGLVDTADTPNTFETDANGEICITGLPDEATYSVTEVTPPAGYEIVGDATQTGITTDNDGDCDSPDASFVNRLIEGGELPDETVTVSIMKHLCTDVASVEEFEAVENAGVGGVPGGFGTLSGLAATVLACPTIVLTGDVPTSGAVSGGQVDFDFTVVDASGTQVLSSDGHFEAAALCESDIDIDVNLDGDKDDCLDVSHYMFEVVDGVVVITETAAPAGSSGVGTLRFTPGSEDETALATSIETVESTGVITLDTTKASETALEDGMIMLHVYNFAAAANEGTQAGQGGPREGTLAGTLPNTATAPASPSSPAALVALVMLSGLGAAAYAVKADVDRRR